ncbi:MAG TPA: 2-isopropylmalate synthase [Spirochaetia bacterium]|nr:2-isopropylmalate synthase [Spirochaetia bacterium]
MSKYKPFPRVALTDRTWPDNNIAQAPIWCSVDLRDGNQALAIPMGVDAKLEMFRVLVDMGFKEIEVGFPSASQTEFDFARRLIEENFIPDDVSIQVLTQAREHLIRRTFESIAGAKNVIVHLYNSTSVLQRRVTFNMNREQIKEIAIQGTKIVKSLVPTVPDTYVRFEYSPESFSDTEIDYALEVCEAVMDVWEPTAANPMILNLPATVEWSTPNVYADQIEWFCRHMRNRDHAIISLHTHNDRGTGVAATELGLMAGAQRVEGTLFGNGERTGNLDIVTVALNMFSHGISTNLDVFDIPRLREKYEELTGMSVHERHPYAGDLVFTAFSGSHQDAIKKGMDLRKDAGEEELEWAVPYLAIDPQDIGRNYQAIIRINSQSGKGGVAYVLSRDYGFDLPKAMHPEFGGIVNIVADELGRELARDEIHTLFRETYLDQEHPLKVVGYDTESRETPERDGVHHTLMLRATVSFGGKEQVIKAHGNGPIDALVHAMADNGWNNFQVTDFKEQAIGTGSGTEAVAYVQVKAVDLGTLWGVGIDSDISMAGLKAVASAYNRMVGAANGDARTASTVQHAPSKSANRQ